MGQLATRAHMAGLKGPGVHLPCRPSRCAVISRWADVTLGLSGVRHVTQPPEMGRSTPQGEEQTALPGLPCGQVNKGVGSGEQLEVVR